jgi:hypothetical protein
MTKGGFDRRIAELEQNRTEVRGPVVLYGYHAGNEEERERNRAAAIAKWEAEHGLKLDVEKTLFVVWVEFTTREEVEKYGEK